MRVSVAREVCMEGSGGSVVCGGGDPFYGTHIPDLHRSFVSRQNLTPLARSVARSVGGYWPNHAPDTALLGGTLSQIKVELKVHIGKRFLFKRRKIYQLFLPWFAFVLRGNDLKCTNFGTQLHRRTSKGLQRGGKWPRNPLSWESSDTIFPFGNFSLSIIFALICLCSRGKWLKMPKFGHPSP